MWVCQALEEAVVAEGPDSWVSTMLGTVLQRAKKLKLGAGPGPLPHQLQDLEVESVESVESGLLWKCFGHPSLYMHCCVACHVFCQYSKFQLKAACKSKSISVWQQKD